MKHVKLFEEYQSFDDHTGFGTAGRDLKSELPEVGEKFLVPGYVNTGVSRRSIELEPGDVLQVKNVYPPGRRSHRHVIEFTINYDGDDSYECPVNDFAEFLCYDISGDNLKVISPETMLKRIPEWRGKLAGKKFGF